MNVCDPLDLIQGICIIPTFTLVKCDSCVWYISKKMYNNISICIITLIINSSLGHIVSILFLISQFVNIINQISNTLNPLPPMHHRESWHPLVWFINLMLHISVKLFIVHVYLMFLYSAIIPTVMSHMEPEQWNMNLMFGARHCLFPFCLSA